MSKCVFIGSFLLALLFQGAWWGSEGVYDAQIWGEQPHHMLAGDPEQFNAAAAYGHPGGPIIYGAYLASFATGAAPSASLLIALTVLASAAIALIALISYRLWGRWQWSALLTVLFAAHPLYTQATPPSALAALLAVSLVLLAIIAYREPSLRLMLLWGALAGLLVSTRADIGGALALVLGLALLGAAGARKLALAALAAFAVFVAFDPFTWFMPVQHVHDLVFKAYYHYALIPENPLPLLQALMIGVFALVSIVLGSVAAGTRRLPVPLPIFLALLGLTFVLVPVLLTAQYQAPRYFMPLVFIWEALLLAFVAALAEKRHTLYVVATGALLAAYPLAHFAARFL